MKQKPPTDEEARMSLKDLEDDDDFDAFFSAVRASASTPPPAPAPEPAKPILDDDDDDWFAQACANMPPGEEPPPKKKSRAAESRAYPKQLPPREPDQVISEGSTEWPADATMKAVKGEALTFEQAGEEIQKHVSRVVPMALGELEELAQAWRVDMKLAPTSLKAIEKILDLAGGSENKRPLPEKKKTSDLSDLAKALMSGTDTPVDEREDN